MLWYYSTISPRGIQCPGLLYNTNRDRDQMGAWLGSDLIVGFFFRYSLFIQQ